MSADIRIDVAGGVGRVLPRLAALKIGFLVHDVSRLRRAVFDQAMKPLGITRSQWWALANLSRHASGGMAQSELAEVMDISKVTVGRLLERLEASGHVLREVDPSDRRNRAAFVTAKGEAALTQMADVGGVLNVRILAGIPADSVRIAEDVLARMKANLVAMARADGGEDS